MSKRIAGLFPAIQRHGKSAGHKAARSGPGLSPCYPLLLAALLLAPAARAADAAKHYVLSMSDNQRFLADTAARPDIVKLANGVMVRIITAGGGVAVSGRGDKVSVTYKGYLINGQEFDESKPGKPSVFTVGRVIPGWTEALLAMKEGDRREIIVPADQAYGDVGGGAVPPDQTLIFLLQLEHVEHPP